MDAEAIKRELNGRVLELCGYLLPGGKKKGHEYRVGSVHGEVGDSMGVHLTGDKAGVWCDFASGERGDLFDLIQRVKGGTFVEALDFARDFLGVERPAFHRIAPPKAYVKPSAPKGITAPKPGSPVYEYLTRERGLALETIRVFRIGEGQKDGRAQIVFGYKYGPDLEMLKYLFLDRPEGKKDTYTSKDARPCLFGWQAVPDAAREIVITEGEFDAMTWHQMGFPALSVPRGTSSLDWVEAEYPRLERFETVFLAFDADDPGRLAAHKLAPRFGSRARILGHLSLGKDANDWLRRGANREQFRALIERARDNRPESLKSPIDYLDDVLGLFYPDATTYQGFEPPFRMSSGKVRFRPSEVSVWTGYNGHGKSEMLNFLCVCAAAQEERICIASLEVPPARTIKRLVRQATGEERPSKPRVEDAIRWLADRFSIYDRVGATDLRKILEAFDYARKRFGATQFVIDNLARLGIGEDDYNGQAEVLSTLCDFVNSTGAHVHLVAHPRKAGDESTPPGKLDVRGGAVLTDLSHNVFAQWRNVDKHARLAELESRCDPKGEIRAICENEEDATWSVLKQRETGDTPKVRLWWDRHSLQFHESPFANPLCFVGQSVRGKEITAEIVGFPEPPAPSMAEVRAATVVNGFPQYEDDGELPF